MGRNSLAKNNLWLRTQKWLWQSLLNCNVPGMLRRDISRRFIIIIIRCKAKPDCNPSGYRPRYLLIIVNWSLNWFVCVQHELNLVDWTSRKFITHWSLWRKNVWIEQTKIGCHSNVASTIATQVHRNHLSLMTLHPQTLSSLASFKSGLVLPFWYRLTQDVLETHIRLTVLCPGLPGWAGTRKVKPIWVLLEQETVSSSGISWAMQVCTLLQTDNHASTSLLKFFTGRMPLTCRPTNSVNALKAQSNCVLEKRPLNGYSSILVVVVVVARRATNPENWAKISRVHFEELGLEWIVQTRGTLIS